MKFRNTTNDICFSDCRITQKKNVNRIRSKKLKGNCTLDEVMANNVWRNKFRKNLCCMFREECVLFFEKFLLECLICLKDILMDIRILYFCFKDNTFFCLFKNILGNGKVHCRSRNLFLFQKQCKVFDILIIKVCFRFIQQFPVFSAQWAKKEKKVTNSFFHQILTERGV